MLLALALIGLAAPGAELVPGADDDAPRWLLGAFGEGFGLDGRAYLALLYGAFAAYLVLVWRAPLISALALRRGVLLAIGLFVLAPPLLSLDVFSYIAYGRLGTEGLNPYELAPADLPGDAAAERVEDFRDAPSVYGPLFTLLSLPLALAGVPFALWALKLIAGASALALARLAGRYATERGADGNRALAFVGLNPILLVHGVGGAHNDVLMALLVLAGFVLLARRRAAGAGVALAAAAGVKTAGVLVAPFALLASRRLAPRFLAGAALAAVALAAFAFVLWGTSAAASLDVLGSSQGTISRYSAPATLARGLGADVELLRVLMAGGFVLVLAWLLRWSWRGGDPARAAGWAVLALLVASAYATPWYVLWALPLAAVSRDHALIVLTLAFSAFQLVNAVPL